jgi:hypothetical protein
VNGWFEYDFDIGATGWYTLWIHGNTNGVEFLVDPDKNGRVAPEARFLSGSGQNPAVDKIGNVWLTAGRHRVRLQRYYWTGFPSISAVELRPSDGTLGDSVAVATPDPIRIFRKGQCPSLEIVAGGLSTPEKLGIAEMDPYTFVTYRSHSVPIPASPTPTRQRFALTCDQEGFRILWFADSKGSIRNERLRGFFYEVTDSQIPPKQTSKRSSAPVLAIDCAEQSPDYSGGATRVVRRNYGAYRESDETGWTRFQRTPELVRRAVPEPSWFAYKLSGLTAQERYRIEVDFPDDRWRTFGMAMRESTPLSYPVAVGVDTGQEFRLSHGMQTMAMTVWPRAGDPRLTFMTAHEGSRAACSQIRVYRADAPEPIRSDKPGKYRRFMNWQEEGANFASLLGPIDENQRGQHQAAERWAEAAAGIGVSTLVPTVVIYSFALYPSKYNVAFSNPGDDSLRRVLLAAEKYRLGVIPELHPRADELAWGDSTAGAVPDNLLVDKNGRNNYFAGDGKTRNFPPHFNPLSAKNQDWYVAMVGELADRYKDSPALEGVSLRVMQWANPALNNLVSLDWGYDDTTVAQFKRETHSAVPMGSPGDPNRFAQRYSWLTTAGLQAWVNWRCSKIANLITRIRDRLRQTRGDLNLYLDVFAGGEAFAPSFSAAGGVTMRSRLREAGIDTGLLAKIDGVVLVNSGHSFGRREPDALRRGYRDTLLDPASISAMRGVDGRGHFMSTQNYLEATDAVIPPDRLGFPANTKRTWAGIVANPPGRFALERYAVLLAEGDALTLGDGGNGYSFGPPVVREFMETFRRLPAVPFNSRRDALDPVAVRTLSTPEGLWIYAVNRERYPVKLDLTLTGASRLSRLADGLPLTLADGRISFELKPYELLGIRAEKEASLGSINTEAPKEERDSLERMISTVERQSRLSSMGKLLRPKMGDADIKLLQDAAAEARKAFSAGHLWRARSVLEHSSLLAAYRKFGCFPPGLLDGGPEVDECEP